MVGVAVSQVGMTAALIAAWRKQTELLCFKDKRLATKYREKGGGSAQTGRRCLRTHRMGAEGTTMQQWGKEIHRHLMTDTNGT